ncbi:MAG: ParB/RepB/Spo0J family partition protein [Acidobacteria bacterium]|nr:ParB/RepB/Spo0J family partition protein [Acidobacteriota bacterium]MBI3422875.1 ParB/RepB/Spo0J family partition protein [Acidobacteriota bacterium]
MRHDRHYVEELASLRGAPIGRMIPIDRLEPNPQQPRIEFGDLEELIASIREKGVLEPLLVRPSQVGGRFMIISGERRFRAAREVGLTELPCIEMDVDDRAVAEIALIENLQRKDLTAFEEAEGLQVLAERFDYTHDEIAKKIGKSRSTVTEALTIATLPNDVKEQCRRADISSKSLLLQVVRQPNIEIMRQFVTRIAEQGLTRDEARKARSKKQPRSQPFVYRYQAANREFVLEVKFKRSSVSRDELMKAMQVALEDAEQRTE